MPFFPRFYPPKVGWGYASLICVVVQRTHQELRNHGDREVGEVVYCWATKDSFTRGWNLSPVVSLTHYLSDLEESVLESFILHCLWLCLYSTRRLWMRSTREFHYHLRNDESTRRERYGGNTTLRSTKSTHKLVAFEYLDDGERTFAFASLTLFSPGPTLMLRWKHRNSLNKKRELSWTPLQPQMHSRGHDISLQRGWENSSNQVKEVGVEVTKEAK